MTTPAQQTPARPRESPAGDISFTQHGALSTPGQPAPTPQFPTGQPGPGTHPAPNRGPREELGKCQPGDGVPDLDRPPKTPVQDGSTCDPLCGRKHHPPQPKRSLFGKGLAAHSSASASFPREQTARGGWGGPLAPLALTLSAAVPSGPLGSLPPGRAGPPVRHSTTPPPCPAGPSPRLPPAAGPPRHWRPARRCCRAIGCGSLSIKAVLRSFRTNLAQRKNRTQAGRAKRVNREECTMRGDRRREPWPVWGQITGAEGRTAPPITIPTS